MSSQPTNTGLRNKISMFRARFKYVRPLIAHWGKQPALWGAVGFVALLVAGFWIDLAAQHPATVWKAIGLVGLGLVWLLFEAGEVVFALAAGLLNALEKAFKHPGHAKGVAALNELKGFSAAQKEAVALGAILSESKAAAAPEATSQTPCAASLDSDSIAQAQPAMKEAAPSRRTRRL